MTTYANVVARIQDDLQTVSLTAQAQQQILLAIRHYRTYPLWFNEATTTLSASQAYVALPSDFISDVALYLKESGTDRELTKWSPKEIFEHRPTSGGRPTAWTIYGNQIEFNRSCDAVYTLPLRYIKELTALSAGSDENEWLISGEDLIVYRAEKMLYDRVLKNRDEAARSAMLESEAFKALSRYNQSKLGMGEAKAHYL